MSRFHSQLFSVVALAGITMTQLSFAQASAQEAGACLDHVAFANQYAMVKAANKIYFHSAIRTTNAADWVAAEDNKPWAEDAVADIDVAASLRFSMPGTFKETNGTVVFTPTDPNGTVQHIREAVAAVAAGDDVYVHSNLLDQAGKDWESFNRNHPWAGTPVTSVVVNARGMQQNQLPYASLFIGAGSKVYYFGNIFQNSPLLSQKLGTDGWVDVTANGPWKDALIQHVGMTIDNNLAVKAGGVLYVLPVNLNPYYYQADKVIAGGAKWVATKQILDWDNGRSVNQEIAPGAISSDTQRMASGGKVYNLISNFGGNATTFFLRDVTAEEPWGDVTIDDIDRTTQFETTVPNFRHEDIAQTLVAAGNRVWRYRGKPSFGSLTNGTWEDVTDNLEMSGCKPANKDVDLAMKITAPASVKHLQPVVYAITVTNNGPATANSARVTIPMNGAGIQHLTQFFYFKPEHNAFLKNCTHSVFTKELVCQLGQIKSGESKTVELALRMLSNNNGGSSCVEEDVSVTAKADSAGTDLNPADNAVPAAVRRDCGKYLCNNRIDDNNDGAMDSQDPKCRIPGTMVFNPFSDGEGVTPVPTRTFPEGQVSSLQTAPAESQAPASAAPILFW